VYAAAAAAAAAATYRRVLVAARTVQLETAVTRDRMQTFQI